MDYLTWGLGLIRIRLVLRMGINLILGRSYGFSDRGTAFYGGYEVLVVDSFVNLFRFSQRGRVSRISAAYPLNALI